MADNGSPVAGSIIGLLFAAVGAVLMTDFRGAASFHAKAAVGSAQPLRRIPPWRWLPARTPEEDFRFALRIDRLIGGCFLVAGLVGMVTSLLAQL